MHLFLLLMSLFLDFQVKIKSDVKSHLCFVCLVPVIICIYSNYRQTVIIFFGCSDFAYIKASKIHFILLFISPSICMISDSVVCPIASNCPAFVVLVESVLLSQPQNKCFLVIAGSISDHLKIFYFFFSLSLSFFLLQELSELFTSK